MGSDDCHRRPTLRFDSSELAELTRDAPADHAPARSRTETLPDPLTTELLAEVARRSKTLELELDEEIDSSIDNASLDDTVPPRIVRRR
jgi:hypothetical protein